MTPEHMCVGRRRWDSPTLYGTQLGASRYRCTRGSSPAAAGDPCRRAAEASYWCARLKSPSCRAALHEPVQPQSLGFQRQLEIYLGGWRARGRPCQLPEELESQARARCRLKLMSTSPEGPGVNTVGPTATPSSVGASSRGCCGVSHRDLSVSLLGLRLPVPLLLARSACRRCCTPMPSWL